MPRDADGEVDGVGDAQEVAADAKESCGGVPRPASWRASRSASRVSRTRCAMVSAFYVSPNKKTYALHAFAGVVVQALVPLVLVGEPLGEDAG